MDKKIDLPPKAIFGNFLFENKEEKMPFFCIVEL